MTNHGLPRFSDCEFHTAYPFGQVTLADAKVPLDVRLEAFNPLIPGHADDSGIPVAVLRFVLTNPGSAPVEAAVCGGLENFSGTDGLYGLPERTFNELREDGEIRGVFMQSTGVAKTAEQWGTMALTATATATATAKDITYRAAWPVRSWGDALLDFWDDFANDGRLEGRDGGQDPDARAMASRGTVLALTGFQCSGMERSIAVAARPGVHFWSNGAAGGGCVDRTWKRVRRRWNWRY